jgi:transposase
MNLLSSYAAVVGIDWAHKKHDLCLRLADDSPLERAVLTHIPEAIDAWAMALRQRFGVCPIAVCLESRKVPLIHALLKYDFLALFPVSPQTLARYRRALRPSRAKDDPSDAQLLPLDDADLFAALPGAGAQFAPRLLVAFGEDRQRFPSADSLCRYAGIAPVTERSGHKHWVHWRYSCPKFLRQSFVEWANEPIRHSFWARAFYQHQRDKGKSHQMAVRALAFKWIRILWRCWQDRRPYDEAKYLMSLEAKGSPLIGYFAN